MKTPVLIVICASAAVLCTLPAIYLFLAYHTYKERKGWRVDYDKAVKRLEAEQQRNPRPMSTATPDRTYSSAERGRAPVRAPARPGSAYNPRAAPPRPQTLRRKGPLRPTTPGSRLTASTSLSSSSGRHRSSSGHHHSSSSSDRQMQQSMGISLDLLNLQTNILNQQ